jgi:hypothetical protein
MSYIIEQIKPATAPALQASQVGEVVRMPDKMPGDDEMPGILIIGDIRLRVNEFDATHKLVTGHYRIETKGMQEPLHIIWMDEGNVLHHTGYAVDVAFDMRGIPAGKTLTRVLSAQVTDCNGRGRVVHCSVFVQILVVGNDRIKGEANTGHQDARNAKGARYFRAV